MNYLWSGMMLLYFQIVSVIEMLVSYCNGTSLHNYCQNQSRYLINHSILCYFHTITLSQIYCLLSFFRRSNWIGLTFRGDLKLLTHFVSDPFLRKLVFLIFYKSSSYIISSSKKILLILALLVVLSCTKMKFESIWTVIRKIILSFYIAFERNSYWWMTIRTTELRNMSRLEEKVK